MKGGEVVMMTEAAKAARKAYLRSWRKRNPDRVREHQRRYWEKKAREARKDEQQGEGQRGGA